MNHSVKLIAVTQPLGDNSCETAEDLVAYIARVSNPTNQDNKQTASKLLNYLVKNSHWSPFEMVHLVMEIQCTRTIGRQILRHKSFSFQEFCITGDTLLFFDAPHDVNKNKKGVHKIRIDEFWDKWHNGAKPIKYGLRMPLKNRMEKMYIRIFDMNAKIFKNSRVLDVYKTGIKPVYEIELYDGKKIKCTKEEQFLTPSGFDTLENIIGLDHQYHVMSKKGIIGVNGVPLYQNKEWLVDKRNNGLTYTEIGNLVGVKQSTIHKWVKKLNLGLSLIEARKRSAETSKRLHGALAE